MKETLSKLSKKVESNFNLFDFNAFKVFEKTDEKLEETDDEENEVLEIWYTHFDEGEEKEWMIKESQANEINKKLESEVSEPFPIEGDKAK
jgi:hypothetical protein